MIKSNTAPCRYWIVYGFGEGRRHGRHLRAALRQAGFEPADSLTAADIVIAHSGGCFDLPALPNTLVVLCQPAANWQHSAYYVWYVKTLIEIRRHRELGIFRRWVWKISLNIAHIARHPGHTRRIVQLAQAYRHRLPDVVCRRQVVIINRDDPWSNRITPATLPVHTNALYLGLAGSHDELWTSPAPLVQIITQVADHAV